MLGDAETTPLPDSPHPPTPSPVTRSPTSLSPDTVPIVKSLPELSPPHTVVTLPDPVHAVLHYELTMRGTQPIILPTNTFIDTPMEPDPYVADALRSPSPPALPIPSPLPRHDDPLDHTVWQQPTDTSSAGATPLRLSTTLLYPPTEPEVTQAPTRQWQTLWNWTHENPAPPPQTATLSTTPLLPYQFSQPNALGERVTALPSSNALDAWSDTHKLIFAPLPGRLYLPNGREQLLCVRYHYTHDDGSITRFIGKITYNTARVLSYLHTLHTSYPLYYFWKGQDLVTPRRELQKFIELYCKVKGVPAGVELDEDDQEYPPHIPPSKEIARVQLPHASALIEHYHKAAVEGVPFTAYLAKLEDPLETHTFEFVIYFFPQNPTLAYYVHKTDEDGDKVTDQVATFDYDEWKNGQRFQDLTSLKHLALVLFVLPADAFKKYRCTGKLNVFGFEFPTFKHLENLDHYRPVPLHLSVVTDEHPSITSLFA